MSDSSGYIHRSPLFNRADPSHQIEEKNAWGGHDEFSFILPAGIDQLHFRCCACNNICDNSFIDTMVCPTCGWVIPSKAMARDIAIEAHNVSVNWGGWTHEAREAYRNALSPSTCSPASRTLRPVGEVARNMTAWHLEAQTAGIRQARIKNKVISELRSSSPVSTLR